MVRNIVFLFLLQLLAWPVFAQPYPAKPIRLVIPWPAGGPTDVLGRVFAERLSKVLGQPLVIDNRGGASGAIGADLVARATPDGYTLMVQSMTNQAMFPATIKNLRFDPIADFEPITQIVASPMVIVSHPSFPATSMTQLVAYARAKPGAITFASFGQGSSSHLGIELLMKLASIKVNHIPYKGGAPAVADALAGHVQVALVGVPVALPHIKQSRLRALAVTTEARIPQLPETPSVNETSGLEAYALSITYGFLAPPRTPPAIIERLNASALEVIRSSEFAQKMLEIGMGAPIGNSPAAMAASTRKEIAMLADLARAAGIEPECPAAALRKPVAVPDFDVPERRPPEARLLFEGHGGVDAELGDDAVVPGAHVLVAACVGNHEQVAGSFHARGEGVFHVDRIADVDVVVHRDDEVQVLQRGEGGEDRVALQPFLLRTRLLDAQDRDEAVQAARGHLGVFDDGHRRRRDDRG